VRNQKCPVTKQRGKIDDCPFKRINSLLVSRDMDKLEIWKAFLYYLLSGLNKLPMIKERVYRALDKPVTSLSNQYQKDSKLCWIGFTSTSLKREIMNSFVHKQNNEIKNGTYMMIDIIEGKDISLFSLYPEESEILLLPNSYFTLKDILTDHWKQLLGLPLSVDAIVLSQLPTPPRLLLMKQSIDQGANIFKQQLEQLEKLNKELQEKLKNKDKDFDNEKVQLNNKIKQLENQLENQLEQEKSLNLKIKQLEDSIHQLEPKNKQLEKLPASSNSVNSLKEESVNKPISQKTSNIQVVTWGNSFNCNGCGTGDVIECYECPQKVKFIS